MLAVTITARLGRRLKPMTDTKNPWPDAVLNASKWIAASVMILGFSQCASAEMETRAAIKIAEIEAEACGND